MVNKLFLLDANCFSKMADKKILLNRSLLNDKDIDLFQKEANIKFFSVLPPMDDRVDNSETLFPFLEKLGFYRRIS